MLVSLMSFITVTSLVLSCIVNIDYAEGSENGIEVITSSLTFDSKAQAHLLGEVINNGEGSVDDIFVTAIFYDDAVAVASNYASIQMDNLRPGEKSSFDIVFEDIQDIEGGLEFDSYDLFADSHQTGPKTACLALNVTESFLDEMGDYHLTGIVQNNGSHLTNSIKVAATFYNSTGYVVAIDAAQVVNEDDEESLNPNENATFDLVGIPHNSNSNISSYSISVESAEYSMINGMITKDYVSCPVQLSTSLTLNINNSTANSLTQDLLVYGQIATFIESERYVRLEVYHNASLFHVELCELDDSNSYLCTVTFYHLSKQDFVLVAEYAGAVTELTFVNPYAYAYDENDITVDYINSIRSVNITSAIVLGTSSSQVGNSTIQLIPKVMLTSNLTNNNPHLQEITMIVQIKDANNTVVFLDFRTIILAPAENISLLSEWIPNINGTATVEFFVWNKIGHNSQPLSEVNRKQILLTGSL